MTILELISERFGDDNSLLYPTGFEDAVIGIDEQTCRLILSKSKVLEILMERDEMDLETALEHYYYNMIGSNISEEHPIYCEDYL